MDRPTYWILLAWNVTELEGLVRRHMVDGYVPCGGVSIQDVEVKPSSMDPEAGYGGQKVRTRFTQAVYLPVPP